MESMNVLVVDDELGIRTGIARVLRGFSIHAPNLDGEIHFETAQAENAEEALEMIRREPPQILLLDNKLPGMSGIEALDIIAAMNLDMLTIMITAYASIETAVRATKQGAYDFLPKPFTPADLKNTVRKAAEHLVVARHARELAAEKRKVRFQFISVLAHELKAPLNAIEGYLHILQDGSAGDDPKVIIPMVDRCLTRTEYMRKMIADLLDLTRIESGERKREIAELDLVEAAQHALDTFAPEAASRNITLALHSEGKVPLCADRSEMDIVLNNLVSNAVKYNRENGRVDVTVERRDGAARIRVADTGIGMSAAESAKLFQEFVRIKNAKTKNILGSGLGLSILKKLTAMYHGDIQVESEPDKGTTFTVTLLDSVPEQDAAEAATA